MISPQFYSQLSVCPTCQGWGVEKFPPKKKVLACKECGGSGVFLVQTDQTFVWGLPSYIDFGRRGRIKVLKVVILFVFVLLLFVIIALLPELKFSIFNF